MSYIGNTPVNGAFQKLDSIAGSFNGVTATFTTAVSAVAVQAGAATNLLIVLNGVLQEPSTDYTISGTTITFTTAPPTGTTFFGVRLGNVGSITNVSAGTIVGASLADNSVDLAGTKITNVLTYDHGGTGIGLSGAAGNVLYSTGSGWKSEPLIPSMTLTAAPYVQAASGNSYALVCNTNQKTYSEQLDNASGWSNWQATVTASATTAPNGSAAGAKIVENSTTNTHSINVTTPVVAGQTYTWSAYVKSAERTKAVIGLNPNNGAFNYAACVVDLTNGTIFTTIGTPISYGVVSVGGGWYRAYVTQVAIATTNGVPSIDIYAATTLYLGNGTSGIYAWGAQFELGTVMSAYSPTTTVAAIGQAAATNSLTYSEQFDNAAWTKGSATVTANTVMAPDGTTTADKIVESGTNSVQYTFQSITTAANVARCFSFYVKAAGRTTLVVEMDKDGSGVDIVSCIFNLTTGVASGLANGGTGSWVSAGQSYVGDGWYRCWLSGIPASTAGTSVRHLIYVNQSSAYTGDGTSGVYLWGAQSELGWTPTSYIPTTTAAASRTAGVVAPQRVVLPATPAENSWLKVSSVNTVSTNVIDPNGSTLLGTSGPMTIDNPSIGLSLQYINNSWRFV